MRVKECVKEGVSTKCPTDTVKDGAVFGAHVRALPCVGNKTLNCLVEQAGNVAGHGWPMR